MPDLGAMLRALAERGELTHLSICAVAGNGPKNIVYSASFTPATVEGSGFGRSADPEAAILEALADPRLKKLHASARRRAAATPPAPEPEPEREPEPWEL